MSSPRQQPHAQAILDQLAAAGLKVGDHQNAKTTDGKIVAPSVVLYLIPGGTLDGPTALPEDDGDLRFQLTSIGRTAAEARVTADKAAAALTFPVEVSGRSISRVRPITAYDRVDRDDDVQPPLFYAIQRFGLLTVPA